MPKGLEKARGDLAFLRGVLNKLMFMVVLEFCVLLLPNVITKKRFSWGSVQHNLCYGSGYQDSM